MMRRQVQLAGSLAAGGRSRRLLVVDRHGGFVCEAAPASGLRVEGPRDSVIASRTLPGVVN
jgi:hypothetical protein